MIRSILIAGDLAVGRRVANLVESEVYDKVLGAVKPIVEAADLSIVNFESPIVEGGSEEDKIRKCGPNLHCSAKAAELVRYAGFKAATLANNHILDYGAKGVSDTIRHLDAQGIRCMGAGGNIVEASAVCYYDNVAVVNCCEHEFTIATESTAGACPLNPVQQYYAIKEARGKADHVIVIVHGGHEHFQLPSPRMQETYRFFVDAGADAVVNHHQHCYTGYEVYRGKPIFYGIGNFCFDEGFSDKLTKWHEGYMVRLNLEGGITFELLPYTQCAERPAVEPMADTTDFLAKIATINAVIADPKALAKTHSKWMSDTQMMFRTVVAPYNNRYLRALYVRGLLPTLVSQSRVLRMINCIDCEAHRDRMLHALRAMAR